MNKRYGIGNKTIKIISCLLTLVLFGLAVSFQNSAMAGATAEQEDINEDLTISAEADGKKPEINAENPDELDGVIEREVKANEKSDRIDPPVEKQDSDDPNELAEYFPAVLEDPIPLPSSFSQGSMFKLMGTGLQDTIQVFKTADRTRDASGKTTGCRTFEVTLRITGTPQAAPVDVVLVLDRSGSMGDSTGSYGYNKIAQAPSNNGSYYVKVDGNYRSLTHVSGSGANSVWIYGSSPSYRYVKWDFNGDDNAPGSSSSSNPTAKPFYVRGSTRMHHAKEAAINFACKVLGPDGIPGSRVSIVSYSGPSITSGYGNQNQARTDIGLTNNLTSVVNAINGLSASGGTNTQAGFLQAKSVMQAGNPNHNKVVIMFTDGLPTASNGNRYAETTSQTHVHVTSAIAAGKSIFEDGIADVFTVGLLQNMTSNQRSLAQYILNATQNKGYYEAPNAEDLNEIFNMISQELAYSATNAVVVDKIGDNFNLIEDSLPDGVTYNPNTREIAWSPGTIVNEAEIKYIIKAKPEFEGGTAKTNEYAKLTYTNILGESGKVKDFPVPTVNVPAKLTLTLTDAVISLGESIALGSGTDPAGENYMGISGGDGDGVTYTYEWRVKGSQEVLSNQRHPKVSPTEDTTYQLTVTDSNGCKATAEMKVTVRKTVSVTIVKRVTGNFGDLSREFNFKVTVGGKSEEFKLIHNGSKTLNNVLENAVITLEETNADGYDVTVTASGINDPIEAENGVYTIQVAQMSGNMTITVTNHKDVDIVTGIYLDYLPYIIILAVIIAGIAVILVRKYRISSED